MKLFYKSSVLILPLIFSPSVLSQTTLVSENFETGGAGWSVGGATGSLWHLANNGECTAITKMFAYNLGPSVCNYQTGQAHSAFLYSPNFVLVGPGPWFLSFDYLRSVNGGEFTAVSVENLTAGGNYTFALSPPLANTTGLTSTSATIPATSIAIGDTYRLRFFITGDHMGNSGIGWMVDNVLFTSSAALTPTVTSVAPGYGNNAETNNVTISGSNFSGATAVSFGGVSIPSFIVVNPTTITATLPTTSLTGWVNVSVTTSSGSGTLTNGFDYFVPPTVLGSPCGPATLTWSGQPVIGGAYTNSIIGAPPGSKHTLFIDYSNILPVPCGGSGGGTFLFCRKIAFPMGIGCPPPYCSLIIGYDQSINLAGNADYSFEIPLNPSLIGVVYKTQATYKESGCIKATNALQAVIGP